MNPAGSSVPIKTRALADIFPGPVPFTEKEGEVFFGRDREKDRLRELLQVYRTVLMHAQSGSGKTSLVRAGLIPLLEAAGVKWVRCRVGGVSPSSLRTAPERNVFTTVLLSGLGQSASTATTITEGLSAFWQDAVAKDSEHVLILDQFEELFTNYPDRWSHREPFFEQLAELVKDRPGIRILFVIREEFVSRLEPFAYYLPEQFQVRMFLERLRDSSARDAVRGPFEMAGVKFESEEILGEFIDNLRKERVQKEFSVGDVEEYSGEFPDLIQLQVVCRNLARGVQQAGLRIIGQREIEVHGNPERSLIRFYEEGIERVAAEQHVSQAKLRSWFENKMITSGGTRGTVFMDQRETEGLSNDAVKALDESAHLLRGEPRAGGVWYEVTHDRLIAPVWQSNREWRARRTQRFQRVAALAALVLVVAGGLAMWRIEASRLAEVDEAHRAEQQAEENTKKAQTAVQGIFEQSAATGSNTPVARQVASDVANFLFSANDSSFRNLTVSIGQLWHSAPTQACETLDRLVKLLPAQPAGAVAFPPATEEVRQLRRGFLAGLKTAPDKQGAFGRYLCAHNAAVIIASFPKEVADTPGATDAEVTRWKQRGLAAAFAARPTAHGDVQIVADDFLDWNDASDLSKRLDQAFPGKHPYVVACYDGFKVCAQGLGGPAGYTLFDLPH
jgi:hypothetical protein